MNVPDDAPAQHGAARNTSNNLVTTRVLLILLIAVLVGVLVVAQPLIGGAVVVGLGVVATLNGLVGNDHDS